LVDAQELKEILGEQAKDIIADGLNLNGNRDKKVICPLHPDKNPSMSWFKDGLMWRCHACQEQIDIYRYYTEFKGMAFVEAVDEVSGLTGQSIQPIIAKVKNYDKPSIKSKELEQPAIDYMAKRLIKKETLDFWRVKQHHWNNQDVYVFQYFDEKEQLVYVSYRGLGKGAIKGGCEPNTKSILWGIWHIDKSKPLVITEGQCLSGETEVLTPDGWIRLDEYDNQEVMQVDNDVKGQFVVPIAYINKEYNGDLIRYDSKNHKFAATPDHNIVYVKDGKIKKRTFGDMPEAIKGCIPTAIECDFEGIDLIENQIALILAISADGSIDVRKNSGYNGRYAKSDRYIRFGLKRQRKIVRLRKILDELGIFYSDNAIANECTSICFSCPKWVIGKILPFEWMDKLSLNQRKFIIEEMVHWDGNHVKDRKQYEFTSKLFINATFMQTIAETCGYHSTIIKKVNEFGTVFKVSVLLNKSSVSWQHKSKYTTTEHYDKNVYCVQVPSGMILIRYKNKVSVIGNCDAMAVWQSGHKNVVSVPNGSNNLKWIDHCWEWLKDIPEFVVFADNDKPGLEMANNIQRKLDNVKIITGLRKDPNEILYHDGPQAILNLINGAIKKTPTGLLDLSEVEYKTAMQQTAETIETGFLEYDSHVEDWKMQEITVIFGRNGEGKTTLISQIISHCIEKNVKTFLYSGEMSENKIQNWLYRQMIGSNKSYLRTIMTKYRDKTEPIPKVVKAIKDWHKGKLYLFDRNEHKVLGDLNSFFKTMEIANRRYGAKLFVIDNLMAILEENADSLYSDQANFVQRCKNFAINQDVHVVLLAHPNKGKTEVDEGAVGNLEKNDISGSNNIANKADNIIAIERIWKDTTECDALITSLKDRESGKRKQFKYFFSENSLRFYNDWTKENEKYGWEEHFNAVNN